MPLPVVPVAPGWASGPVHLVDDPIRWSSGEGRPEVIGFPVLWWPPTDPLPRSACAVVLHGLPDSPASEVRVPVVGGVDRDVLREGEVVEVNGSKGTLTIPGTTEVPVVTALLERDDGRILLLERSARVGSFAGRWSGVSGYLEDPTPVDQVYREIREELGLGPESLHLEGEGAPVLSRDGNHVFVVHPFRFRTTTTEIRLDWENARAEWVAPEEIRRRPTVPKLDRVWEAVRPSRRPKD